MDTLVGRSGWGERKISLLIALQKLHRKLAAFESSIEDYLIGSLVDSILLPDAAMREMTIREFVNTNADALQLKGRFKIEFDGLRRLLMAHTGSSGDANSSSYLREFERADMDWRDVPLNVSKRVADFLDRFELTSLEQLDRLALTAHVTCPKSGKPLAALEQENFGDTSVQNLRNALEELNRLGLVGYRRGLICGVDELPDAELHWREIPLRISKRLATFLAKFRIETLKDVHALAVRMQVRCPESGNVLSALEQENFSEISLAELRKELLSLAELGLDRYRYGKSGKPETAAALARLICETLSAKDTEVFRLRSEGLTLEEVAVRLDLTRARIGQIERRAQELSRRYRPAATDILRPLDDLLSRSVSIDLDHCVKVISADEPWQLWMAAAVAKKNYELLDAGLVSRFSKRQAEALDALVRDAIRNGTLSFGRNRLSLSSLVTSATDPQKWFVRELVPLVEMGEEALATEQLAALIGVDWLRTYVRSQLVDARPNGLFFDEIATCGFVGSGEELSGILGSDAEILADGRFRRPGDTYNKSDEILEIVRRADAPVSAPEIMEASDRQWHQPVLVGRYLSVLHEIVTTDRGLYVHIDKLSLSVRDVAKIAGWGAELLAGERKLIDGE